LVIAINFGRTGIPILNRNGASASAEPNPELSGQLPVACPPHPLINRNLPLLTCPAVADHDEGARVGKGIGQNPY
jgi:hypothetical protein